MARDILLELKGIKGESKKEDDWIDVISWGWGMSNHGSWHDGGGGGEGKGEVHDITITKYVDKATPNIMLACMTGEHVDDATLILRKAGGEALEYLTIKMKKVCVTSVQTGSSGDDDRFTESISLSFAEVEVEYKPQADSGSGEGAVPIGYSIEKGEVI